MARNRMLSQRSWLFFVLSIFTFLVLVSVSCNIPTKATIEAPKEAPQGAPQEPQQEAPKDAPVATVEVQSSQAQPSANVARDYYGPACDSGEEEGAPYHWSVELLQDPATGKLEGTIKFHACPGGGRAVYRVSGTTGNGTTLTLPGNKVSGGGDLFGTAPGQETFTFNTSSGQLSPNLAP